MKQVDDDAGAEVQKGQSDVKKDQGVARAISVSILLPEYDMETGFGLHTYYPQSFIDPSLSWKDIPWFQSVTKSRFFGSSFLFPLRSKTDR